MEFEHITLAYQNKEAKLAPLYVPEAGTALVGWDAIIALELEIRVKRNSEANTPVKPAKLTEEDEKDINSHIWVREGK